MGELQTALEEMFGAFERGDVDALLGFVGSDVQAVDEISRKWMRGRDEVSEYLRALTAMATNVKTVFNDCNESVNGDEGLLTCWMEQDYTFEGSPQHVSAPTTVMFRRESGQWRFTLFHSIPLPPE